MVVYFIHTKNYMKEQSYLDGMVSIEIQKVELISDVRQIYTEWGFKFHMNDVCAAIGMENFKHMDRLVSRHKENSLL